MSNIVYKIIRNDIDKKLDEQIRSEFGCSMRLLIFRDLKVFITTRDTLKRAKKIVAMRGFATMALYIYDLIKINRMEKQIAELRQHPTRFIGQGYDNLISTQTDRVGYTLRNQC